MKKWIAICMIFVVMLSCNACSDIYELREYTDPDQYQDVWKLSERGTFELGKDKENIITFPDIITDLNVLEFYCWYAVYFPLGTGYQIHLSVQYNEDDYAEEIERLASIELTAPIQYNTQNFSVPAYVAVWNYTGCYEYVLRKLQ